MSFFSIIPAFAQTVDSFNPDANAPVSAITLQPDGKILVGGSFTSLGGVPHNYLGRLNSDGSIDSDFTPGANNSVTCFLVQPDGKILVGGTFTAPGGLNRNRIARLDSTSGNVESTFNPNVNGPVNALALLPNGQILIGGSFSAVSGTNVAGLARLNSNGTLDPTFNPLIVGPVFAIAVQADGQIIIGGSFTSIGGTFWRCLARLSSTGVLDTNYISVTAGASVNSLLLQPNGQLVIGGAFSAVSTIPRSNVARVNTDGSLDPSFIPVPNGMVNSVAPGENGDLLVGGRFTSLQGQPRNYLGRLKPDGALDAAFNPGADFYVNVLASQGPQKVLLGGMFHSVAGQPRSCIARVENGLTSYAFNPAPNGNIYASALQSGDKLLVGGDFSAVAGQTRRALAGFTSALALDPGFTPAVTGSHGLGSGGNRVFCLTVQADGHVIVGGWFTNLSGGYRYSLGRLNSDGTLDSALNIPLGGYYPYAYCFLEQTNGQVIVGGNFSSIGGQPHTGIARLNLNGTLDSSFNPNIVDIYGGTGVSYSMVLQPDGRIVIGGLFNIVNGVTNNNIVRLNTNGTLDATFYANTNPGYGSAVHCLSLQPDGRILVGGYNGVARVYPDGSLDTNFVAAVQGDVQTMILQADGRIIVGGNFTKLNGTTNYCLGRLNPDGSLDSSFNGGLPSPSSPTYATVTSLAVLSDATLIVGGQFTSLGGQARTNLGRLLNSGAAPQNLSTDVDGTTVTWLRGGANPEVSRVWFDSSADGLQWTNLGQGSRIPGGWQLAGISVSTNDLIRARGFFNTGRYNGSGSIIESVLAPLAILADDPAFGFNNNSSSNSNRFGFSVRGETGRTFVWEATIDLVNWLPVGTNVLGAAPFFVTDPYSAGIPRQFYRVRYQ